MWRSFFVGAYLLWLAQLVTSLLLVGSVFVLLGRAVGRSFLF